MPIANKEKIKIYIAGPFFNEPQLKLIQWIEDHLANAEIDFYSPHLHPGNEGGPINNDTAQKIFRSNVNAILDCTHILAVFDWLLPETNELRQVTLREVKTFDGPQGTPASVYLKSGPLSLPDTGTVFEMGLAWGLSLSEEHGAKPIIGYTDKPAGEGKLNIMLTQACRGIVHGPEGFVKAFWKGGINWDEIKEWTGKNL